MDWSGDDVAIDFPGFGIWLYSNNASWTQLHGVSAVRMAVGSIDPIAAEELVIDFGPSYGIWIRRNGATWTHPHPVTSEAIALGDHDGNGRAGICVDFGSTFGLWFFMNDSAWVQSHPVSPEAVVLGDLLQERRRSSPVLLPGLIGERVPVVQALAHAEFHARAA